MAWKRYHRFEVREVGGAAALLVAAGYPVAGQVTGIGVQAVYPSQGQAVSKAMQFARVLQSIGIDCAFKVFQKPIGTDEPGATPLPADAQVEQEVVVGDTAERDLLHAIREANRKATGTDPGFGVAFGTDFAEDVGGTEGGQP